MLEKPGTPSGLESLGTAYCQFQPATSEGFGAVGSLHPEAIQVVSFWPTVRRLGAPLQPECR